MARSWTELPIGRVVRLHGDPEAVALAADRLPDEAPALVTYAPRPARIPADVVAGVLRELETVAVATFPAWLPGADGVTGPGGAAVPAVRALALRTASATRHFAPFLARLAEHALRSRAAGDTTSRSADLTRAFPAEVRAAGLARVLRTAYRRPQAAILVRLPAALAPDEEEALVTACEWLAHHGTFGVWLTGPPLRSVDRIETVSAPVPDEVAALAREISDSAPASGSRARRTGGYAVPALAYPPLAGLPHPASTAERRLESALSSCAWATGRAWNQLHASRPLSPPIRVDLLWREERCVVEVDGPEHLGPLRRAADRQRDLRLHQDGYAVRRFTNEQVLTRLDTVLTELQRFLHHRRHGTFEGSPHA